MNYETITITTDNRVTTITLNRPEAGNAFLDESWTDIENAVRVAEADNEVGAILITGAGKNFCVGGDIKLFKRLLDEGKYLTSDALIIGARAIAAIRRCKKPVVAAVNGAAVGAGCSLAFACDFRVTSPRTSFTMGFVNMGLCSDTAGLYFLQRLCGVAKTTEMMMSGKPVTGEDSVRHGLTTLLTGDDTLLAEARNYAGQLATRPLYALACQKELINNYFFADMDAYMEQEARLMEQCFQTADFAEAVDAFLAKRSPVFSRSPSKRLPAI